MLSALWNGSWLASSFLRIICCLLRRWLQVTNDFGELIVEFL